MYLGGNRRWVPPHDFSVIWFPDCCTAAPIHIFPHFLHVTLSRTQPPLVTLRNAYLVPKSQRLTTGEKQRNLSYQ